MRNTKEVFLPPQDPRFERRKYEWQFMSKRWESNPTEGYYYPAIRREKNPIGRRTLESYHNESFIDSIHKHITDLEERGEQKKIKILDVGGGAGLYTEQLREEFGDKVKVYSTGLRKKAPKLLRKSLREGTSEYFTLPPDIKINAKPHPNDLKWRSITQLSDFPEFDLIIDTGGEFSYSAHKEAQSQKINPMNPFQIDPDVYHYKGRTEEYIKTVIHKLLPEGKASIGFIEQLGFDFLIQNNLLAKFSKEASLKLIKNPHTTSEPEYILKIQKHKENER